MTPKYIMRKDITTIIDGVTLCRIQALRDIEGATVKSGELGGYIEVGNNLSQSGECWIYDDAKVWDKATVSDNAKVYDTAKIYGFATVDCDAEVSGNCNVFGWARITDKARLHGQCNISGSSIVKGSALGHSYLRLDGFSILGGESKVQASKPTYLNETLFVHKIINSNLSAYARKSGLTLEDIVRLSAELVKELQSR